MHLARLEEDPGFESQTSGMVWIHGFDKGLSSCVFDIEAFVILELSNFVGVGTVVWRGRTRAGYREIRLPRTKHIDRTGCVVYVKPTCRFGQRELRCPSLHTGRSSKVTGTTGSKEMLSTTTFADAAAAAKAAESWGNGHCVKCLGSLVVVVGDRLLRRSYFTPNV